MLPGRVKNARGAAAVDLATTEVGVAAVVVVVRGEAARVAVVDHSTTKEVAEAVGNNLTIR
jgi:hypothetical protein